MGILTMETAEIYSYLFVHKKWKEMLKTTSPDKGFEEKFREYIYEKLKPERISNPRDTAFGLSYNSLSSVPHELDVICFKNQEIMVFELKHYSETKIFKDLIFSFWGKVVDFYLKNASNLFDYRLSLYFVTINENIDDSIRKLCLALGIKLIEPSLMTLGALDHFARDLYQKIPEGSPLKPEVEGLIEKISELREKYDYSFSDIFSPTNCKIEIDLNLIQNDISADLEEIKKCNKILFEVRDRWRSGKS
jgi:hypothetical protein